MGRYKDFKTYIRRKLGLIGVSEFVDDPIEANSKVGWNNSFNNSKFLVGYATSKRIEGYNDVIDIMEHNSLFQDSCSIIDIGCGTGHFLCEVSKRYPLVKLTGTDFSEESINVSRATTPQADLFTSDIYADYISSEKFDIVLCSEVLEHLLYPQKALVNLSKYLSVDTSALVLTVPNGRVDTYQGHINFWSIESWGVFLSENIDTSIYNIESFMYNNNRNIASIITSTI